MDDLVGVDDLESMDIVPKHTVGSNIKSKKGFSKRLSDIFVAKLTEINDDGRPFVLIYQLLDMGVVPARSMAELFIDDVGNDMALMFEGGNQALPIILGRIAGGSTEPRPTVKSLGRRVGNHIDQLDVCDDGQMVLRCGKASITLTREGKIVLRGTYISNRSSGVIRLKGGSVQIN